MKKQAEVSLTKKVGRKLHEYRHPIMAAAALGGLGYHGPGADIIAQSADTFREQLPKIPSRNLSDLAKGNMDHVAQGVKRNAKLIATGSGLVAGDILGHKVKRQNEHDEIWKKYRDAKYRIADAQASSARGGMSKKANFGFNFQDHVYEFLKVAAPYVEAAEINKWWKNIPKHIEREAARQGDLDERHFNEASDHWSRAGKNRRKAENPPWLAKTLLGKERAANHYAKKSLKHDLKGFVANERAEDALYRSSLLLQGSRLPHLRKAEMELDIWDKVQKKKEPEDVWPHIPESPEFKAFSIKSKDLPAIHRRAKQLKKDN